MNHYCCVPHCSSWAKKNPEISFHTFPKAGKPSVIFETKLDNKELMDRRKVWIKNLRIGKPVSEHMRVRLPPEINRILYVRNLPYKITGEEMYDIFGKYGAIRQIRVGNTPETRGTAFVVFEDIFDAKNACDHLSGFNVCNRYLVVLYYQANKAFKKTDIDKKQEEIDKMKSKYGINT